mmetsp:Transcript_19197/g.30931  ORF Transcript_19197/g.30931 Transcript_19197/m.30931 type:complete len:120 (+) Transcript_19197:199-558(+)
MFNCLFSRKRNVADLVREETASSVSPSETPPPSHHDDGNKDEDTSLPTIPEEKEEMSQEKEIVASNETTPKCTSFVASGWFIKSYHEIQRQGVVKQCTEYPQRPYPNNKRTRSRFYRNR